MHKKTERNPLGAGRSTDYDQSDFLDKFIKFLKLRRDKVKIIKNGKGGTTIINHVHLPTIEGFARYLGIERKTLYNWEALYPEVKAAMEEIKQVQLQRLIDKGLEGSYNPAIVKLILSHNHGIREESVNEFKGEIKNNFDDQQLTRIAERIAARSRGNGDPASEEESN